MHCAAKACQTLMLAKALQQHPMQPIIVTYFTHIPSLLLVFQDQNKGIRALSCPVYPVFNIKYIFYNFITLLKYMWHVNLQFNILVKFKNHVMN